MVGLLLILIGERAVRRKWRSLMALGLLWTAFGTFLFVDAIDEELRIPPALFTIPLLLDAAVTLSAAFSGPPARRYLRLTKCGVFVAVSLLILLRPLGSGFTIGLLVGTLLVLDGSWRAASAYVVRFSGWRRSIALAVFEILMGLWSFIPWPTHWEGEVGMDVGNLIIVTGAGG